MFVTAGSRTGDLLYSNLESERLCFADSVTHTYSTSQPGLLQDPLQISGMFVSPPPIPASYSEDVKPEWLQINSVKPLQSAGHLGNICLMPERSGCCVKVRCLFISSFFFFFSWSEAFLSSLFSKVQDFWQISTPRPSEPHLNLRSVCVWRVCGYDRVCVSPMNQTAQKPLWVLLKTLWPLK